MIVSSFTVVIDGETVTVVKADGYWQVVRPLEQQWRYCRCELSGNLHLIGPGEKTCEICQDSVVVTPDSLLALFVEINSVIHGP